MFVSSSTTFFQLNKLSASKRCQQTNERKMNGEVEHWRWQASLWSTQQSPSSEHAESQKHVKLSLLETRGPSTRHVLFLPWQHRRAGRQPVSRFVHAALVLWSASSPAGTDRLCTVTATMLAATKVHTGTIALSHLITRGHSRSPIWYQWKVPLYNFLRVNNTNLHRILHRLRDIEENWSYFCCW